MLVQEALSSALFTKNSSDVANIFSLALCQGILGYTVFLQGRFWSLLDILANIILLGKNFINM